MPSCWRQVPFCLAIVADAVMRREASDIPSQICVHLASFTLGSADLAQQAATVPCMTPELNIARTRVLEYFHAQSASGKRPIFTWFGLGLGLGLGS